MNGALLSRENGLSLLAYDLINNSVSLIAYRSRPDSLGAYVKMIHTTLTHPTTPAPPASPHLFHVPHFCYRYMYTRMMYMGK